MLALWHQRYQNVVPERDWYEQAQRIVADTPDIATAIDALIIMTVAAGAAGGGPHDHLKRAGLLARINGLASRG